jgi:hypothetical protein
VWLAGSLLVAAIVGAAPPAAAQRDMPPGMPAPQKSAIKGRNMVAARRQLEASMEHNRKALEGLADPRQVWAEAWLAYVELRASHESVNYYNDGRVQRGKGNMLMPIANEKYQEARRLTLRARDVARRVVENKQPADERYQAEVTELLRGALRLLDYVQVTLF